MGAGIGQKQNEGMNVVNTPVKDLVVIEPAVFTDERGSFFESYNAAAFADIDITDPLVQMNQSFSKRGVLRGLHFQMPPYAQSKFVRCIRGRLFDVAVDMRKNSPTYTQWFGAELTEENKLMMYIPRGFAHGYLALTDAELLYLCGHAGYHQTAERGIHYADPEIGIVWPLSDAVIINSRDDAFPSLANFDSPFSL